VKLPDPAYSSRVRPGAAPTCSSTAATSAALAAAPTWAKAPAGIRRDGPPGSAASTSSPPSAGAPSRKKCERVPIRATTPSRPACTGTSVPGSPARAAARTAGKADARVGPNSGQAGTSTISCVRHARKPTARSRAGPSLTTSRARSR
jgi:hypothetical protein